jgi:NAD(P)-dependent dehydrogenase (short-subunit alcohol dehydrogenase family)
VGRAALITGGSSNTASIAGKHGHGWLAAYSATKFGVVGPSQALHKELSSEGSQACIVPEIQFIRPGDAPV